MPEDVADPAAGTDLYSAAALPDPEGTVTFFMYWRPILCILYGAVDFLNDLKKYIMYL